MNIIINIKPNLRRGNRKDFIEKTYGLKKSDFCIIVLLYNNIENIQNIIDRLSKESQNENIDLIIIDNSTQIQYQNLNTKGCNCIFIRPKKNLGSSGGYALGMEFAIKYEYEYLTVMEDDITLVNTETFSTTYNQRKKNQIIFINACKNTGGEHSRYVQFASYPLSFISKIGIIDPRYYFRADDLEWKIRIEAGIKKFGYVKKIIDKDYYHPYLKKINGSAFWSYFSIRNQLLMYQKHFNKESRFILVTLFIYIWNGLVRYIIFNNSQFIKAIYLAVIDFLFGYSFKTNALRISQLSKKVIIAHDNESTTLNDLYSHYKDHALLFSGWQFSNVDNRKMKWEKKLSNFRANGTIIGGRNSILLPIFVCSPHIISIDELAMGDEKIFYSVYNNKKFLIRTFISCSLGVISIGLYIPVFLIIIIKILFTRMLGKNH